MITLNVDSNIGSIGWEEFTTTHPTYSAALDGYVNVGPRFNQDKVMINFNHHEEVDRLATRATCAQVLMSIRQGMFHKFRDQSGPKLNIYVSDCDEDVCTSVFLLRNHHLITNAMNPLINRLVFMEDALDSTAGAYPFPEDLPALEELAWIFEPYRQFRLNGLLEKRNDAAYKAVIIDVENRIMNHITGHGKSITLDTRYEVIGNHNGLVIVDEIGLHARTGMFGNGIKAYLSVKKRQDGNYNYVFGKLSPFINYDFLTWTDKLNKSDPAVSNKNKWGGGNNVFGSPKITGSLLSPDETIKVIM